MKSTNESSFRRRNFLKQIVTGTAVAATVPAFGLPTFIPKSKTEFDTALSRMMPGEEAYWEMVKRQFTVKKGLTMMNAANLCPSPYFINEQVSTSLKMLEEDVSFQYRSVFNEERDTVLDSLASYLRVSKKEIGITRNTSESNNLIVHGLDLKKGDEVVLWEQNHPTNGIAWEQQAERIGFTVKWVKLPSNPSSIDDLIKPFDAAITKKTRLLSFSHISNVSGLALPAKELCSFARSKGVISMVDGAQSFGFKNLDLKEMGCDFYSGSTHKWLMGPLENGIIFMKEDMMEQVWPSVIGAGWKPEMDSVDAKFCHLGQRNETTCYGIVGILDFHNSIGKQEVEDRTYQINNYLKQQLQAEISQIEFVTPLEPEFSGGVTIIKFADADPLELFEKLYENKGIACAPTGGLRFSPHTYNTLSDIDKVVSTLKELI